MHASLIPGQLQLLSSILVQDFGELTYRYTGSYAWYLLSQADEIYGMGEIDCGEKVQALFLSSFCSDLQPSDIDIQVGAKDDLLTTSAWELHHPIVDEGQRTVLNVRGIDFYPSTLETVVPVVVKIGGVSAQVLSIVELLAHNLVFRVKYSGRHFDAWRRDISLLCADTITTFGIERFEECLGSTALAFDIRHGIFGFSAGTTVWEAAWTVLWQLSIMYDISALADFIGMQPREV